MAWIKTGGMLPDDYGLSLTVFASEATAEAPIKAGTLLKFDTENPYSILKAGDGDEVQAIAKHDVQSPEQPLGVYVLGYSRNYVEPYSGALAIGDSVVADADGKVKKADAANGTFVIQVNDDTVEFLGGGATASAAAQADSTATDTAGIVTDFNALLAKLRAAGILHY